MKKEFAEIKKRLELEKKALEEIIGSFAKEDSKNPGDWKTSYPDFKAEGTLDEEADEVEEYSSLLPIEKTLELKLQNIVSAIEKIDSGEYGKCEICGKEIETKRIDLVPETKTCSDCKK